MVTWASSYDYDFALAAVPIQLILLVFYSFRRNLPVRSSTSFLLVMLSNLLLTITDIAGCETIAVWNSIPLWVPYAVNIVYFLSFIARDWTLLDYELTSCGGYELLGKYGRIIMALPAIVVAGLVLVTPWARTIFVIEQPDGYHSLALYQSIYLCNHVYLIAASIIVVLRGSNTSKREVLSFLAGNAIMFTGMMVRKQFMGTLVTSYSSILAILVIFIAAQNPDLYRHRKTHLFNREAFNKITAELALTRTPFCCVAISTQNYYAAKALYGPDQLYRSMRLVGAWLVGKFPDHYVFYWGNGDFLLLRKGAEEDEWLRMFHELDERFEQPWEDAGMQVTLATSALGLPQRALPEQASDVRDLIDYAFNRTHEQKTRNNTVADSSLLKELDRRAQVQGALAQALEEHRIEVYLQPLYSARQGRVVGAEALARLNDPKLGFIPPSEFIAVAEQNGDILELGTQIFENVCLFLASNDVAQLGIERINVNLSPAQCLDDGLARTLTAIATAYRIPLSMFDFEVTETSFGDHSDIQKQLLRLQRYGAKFSLDDFGTGVSNLTRLMELPVHVVKLDVGVVQSYFRGELSILPDLVNMIHHAHLKTVLEGVETLEMKEALEQMGCDYEQGYYFSRPLPPDQFMTYIRNAAV